MTPAAVVSPIPDDGRPHRLPLARVIIGAFAVTLVRPSTWALGLAGFLAGGGLVLVSIPVVVLPTPTGFQNGLGGPISSLVFGTPSTALLTIIAFGVSGGVVLLLLATLTAAWAERQAIPIALGAAAEEGILPPADLAGAPGTLRVAGLRLLGLVPVGVAIALAYPAVYAAAYHELVLPDDLATPLPVRVVREVPWQLLAIALTWLVADAAASVGVRRLVQERRALLRAWALGWVDLVRRPVRVMGTAIVGLGVLAVLVAPALFAAALGWDRVRDVLDEGRDPLTVGLAVGIWVAIWLGTLVLAGVGAAIRAAAWTLQTAHRA